METRSAGLSSRPSAVRAVGAARSGRGSCRRATRDLRGCRRPGRRRGRPPTSAALGGPAAGEDAEPPEEPALLLGEQVVAPVDRARAASAGAPAGRAHRRARSRLLAEPLEDRGRAEEPDPRGGELDRERQAAEPLADLPGSPRGVRRRGRDRAGAHVARAVEQRDPGVDVERRDGMAALAPDPEQLPARDEEPQRPARRGRPAPRRPRRPGGAARGCRGRAAPRSRRWRPERLADGCARTTRATPERERDRRLERAPGRGPRRGRRTRRRAGSDRGQPRATAEREARLAAPAGPGQGDDPAVVEMRSRSASISASRPTSSVTSPGRLLGGSRVRSGRAIVRRTADHQPMEPRRLLEVLDRAQALVDELDAVRHRSAAARRALRPAPPTGRSGRRCRRRRSGPRSSRRCRRSPPARPAAPSRSRPSPRWRPIRTRSAHRRASGSAASARWAATAAWRRRGSVERREERVALGLDHHAAARPRSRRGAARRGARRCAPRRPIRRSRSRRVDPRCR